MNNQINNYSAFTLIELLVTTAIVGILTGLAMAVFDNYRQAAYSAQTDVAYRDVLTALITAEGELNQAGCINKSAWCTNHFENFPGWGYLSSSNHNSNKNYLADYLQLHFKTFNRDWFYVIYVGRAPENERYFESVILFYIGHCKGNRGYLYERPQGKNAESHIVTDRKMTINELMLSYFYGENICEN